MEGSGGGMSDFSDESLHYVPAVKHDEEEVFDENINSNNVEYEDESKKIRIVALEPSTGYITEDELTKLGYSIENNTTGNKEETVNKEEINEKDGNVLFSPRKSTEDILQNVKKEHNQQQPTDSKYIPHHLIHNDVIFIDAECSDVANDDHVVELGNQDDLENVLKDKQHAASSEPDVHIKPNLRKLSENSDSTDSGISSPSSNGAASVEFKNVEDNHSNSKV